jgi:phenylacetate-CoA ligase
MANDSYMKFYYRLPPSIQTLGINVFELREWMLRHSTSFHETVKFLKKTEKWNSEEFTNYQNAHLKKIVEYAYKNVPFYHALYKKNNIDISTIRTIEDLEKLPIIKKEDIANNWDQFQSQQNEQFTIRHTSGTTGKPLTIRLSKKLNILDKANAFRRDLWAGYDGGWTARFVGDTPIKDCHTSTFYRRSFVMRRAIFSINCLSVETLPLFVQNLKKLKIEFLQCYPSAGYLLAKYLEKNDSYIPLKAVLYSSEPMFDFQRALIEERFKTKSYGYYAQAEEIISALECEQGKYHLTMVDGILEIVKNNEKVSLGEKGFTIGTSLHNYAMPFIRYALNDFTGFIENQCECTKTSPLIYPIETKVRDFIVTVSGRLISPPLLAFPIREAQQVLESQYVQKALDTVIVRIVKADSYTEKNESALLRSLKQLLGEEMSIKIEYVKKIYETNAYKKRFVINEMEKDYFEKIFEKCS